LFESRGDILGAYDAKPVRFLKAIFRDDSVVPETHICCAGFELGVWRAAPYANHLMEWLPDFALAEDELTVHHGNIYVRMQQAAVRVYTSKKYEKRGEAGEITLHAICRDFFGTVPISNRVFYKSASNDPIKAFDLVHAQIPTQGPVQVWLGESKLYTNVKNAVADAIASMKAHLDAGFLTREKMLLGPQIPKATPRYDEVMKLFSSQTSLDDLLANAVLAVLIAADSPSAVAANSHSDEYLKSVVEEMKVHAAAISAVPEFSKLKFVAIFVPLATKKSLVDAFDAKLKGMQA
jgi:hypothetical protein